MRTHYFIFFAIIIVYLASCKTNKELTSDNIKAPEHSSESAGLPQIENQEKGFSEDENTEVADFAKKVAEVYCEYQMASMKYKDSNDPTELTHLEESKKRLNELKEKANTMFDTEQKKQKFNQIYLELTQNCEH